jgi:cellulose synthase/poly-beta-1,6-N-acetylglucosamine synthase-like glycosyltransferase
LDYPVERFEVVIVDDGSVTPPRELVAQFGELVKVSLLVQGNKGPAGARNFGAIHARGQFLAFTDDDCEPDVGWLRALASYFTRSPDRLVGGRTLNALPNNPYSETSQAIIEVVYTHFNTDPNDAHFFASNNFALSAVRFRELKGFDEKFTTSEDRDLCARWLAHGMGLTYAPEAVVYHAHHLTLRTLWQQHFGYGRGALRFHRRREAYRDGGFKPDPAFYLKLLQSSAAHARKIRVAQMTGLLLWSQLANAAGFFYEKYRGGRDVREF